MLKLHIFLQLSFFCFFLLVVPSCNPQERYRPGGPYYYGGFANYKIPFQPIEELTLDETKLRESYYVAYFDNSGKIVSFTKYLKGEPEFSDKYTYTSTGSLERREMTKYTAKEVVIQFYDRKGKMIKQDISKRGIPTNKDSGIRP
jgi:antitoxin component YwqK of YwqJK toxin-antitoxin module